MEPAPTTTPDAASTSRRCQMSCSARTDDRARTLTALLFGVTSPDATTFAVVPIVLLLVAVGAGYAPARRATRVDPIIALKAE